MKILKVKYIKPRTGGSEFSILDLILDDEDYNWVINKPLKVKSMDRDGEKLYYFYYRENGAYIHLHRKIAKAKKGEVADHINHNTLDNRKSNLRSCTLQQNNYNRKINLNSVSGYKGVTKAPRAYGYSANIQKDGKTYTIRQFETAKEAAIAYNDLAKHLFGEYAHLNKI